MSNTLSKTAEQAGSAVGRFLRFLGWRPAPQPIVPLVAPRDLVISIKEIPGDRPQFKRQYSATLSERGSIAVTMKTFLGRTSSGELKQPNGRWVYFDPDNIADRIIDRDLVKLVEQAVAQIYELDRQFIAANPRSFTDDSGVVWSRR